MKYSRGEKVKMVDVVTLGEAMIRLSPKDNVRLEQATELELYVGGAELNVAVGLARLGMKSGWISKLVDNPLGRIIAQQGQRNGVDVSQVVWVSEGRVGIYFVEFGVNPRAIQVYYDRRDSAVSKLQPEDINWEYIRQSRLLHLTGITPALSNSCRQVVNRSLQEGRNAGIITCFDINYRRKLWSPEEARHCLEELFSQVDILLSSSEDVQIIFGIYGDKEEVARALRERFHFRLVVLDGNIALGDKGDFYRNEQILVPHVVDRLGAGDAFAAGFIFGYLTEGVQKGMNYGAAMIALKLTIPGDHALVTREEVEKLIISPDTRIQR